MLVFFFQAEDGIRDYDVTGVQTCALPIFERGLKGEIAEDFISGLKQLFEDHYIDVPDEKYDEIGRASCRERV